MVLKSHQVVGVRSQIFLPQLHNRVWHLAGAGILQSNRLHRPESQSVASPACNFFDRQAAFEIIQLLPVLFLDRLSCQKSIVEAAVLLLSHRAIDVVGGALVIPCGHVHSRHINRLRFYDGADRIVKIEMRTMWIWHSWRSRFGWGTQ